MLTIRKMHEDDMQAMYEVALRAFKEDRDLYGQYPPLINLTKKCLRPSKKSGYAFLYDDRLIGGGFIWQILGKATLGAIFIEPEFQSQGLGQQIMRMIEGEFPNAKKWTLETPYQSYRNHHFYEKLGYKKIGESQPDKHNDFKVFIYEKAV